MVWILVTSSENQQLLFWPSRRRRRRRRRRILKSLLDLFTDTAAIELIGFKEYYGMPRGHEHDPMYFKFS